MMVDVAKWYYHSKTSSVRLQTLSFAKLLNVSHLRGQSYLTKEYMFLHQATSTKGETLYAYNPHPLVIHHSNNSKLTLAQVAVFWRLTPRCLLTLKYWLY